MNTFFYRLSLRRRLLLSFLVLAVSASALTGLVSYWIAYRSTEQEAAVSAQNTLNKSAQVLNERLRNAIVSTSSMMLSDPFKNIMKDIYAASPGYYYQRLTELQIPLAQMKLTDMSIASVLISTPVGEFFATSDLRTPSVRLENTAIGARIPDMNQVLWVESHVDPLFMDRRKVITLVMKPITDVSVSGVYVIANLKEEVLRSVVADGLPGGAKGYYLVSLTTGLPVMNLGEREGLPEDAELLHNLQKNERGFLKLETEGRTNLVNYARLDLAADWVLVSIQDQQSLLKNVNKIKTTSLLIMAACTLAALIAANGMSGFLLKPLHRLQSMMRQVENNNLDVRFDSKYDDEVTQVGHKFNRMLEQLETLIDEVKEAEGEKRRMEIKALQAQIDPHFLYNTLNAIIWKSVSSRNQEVTDMITSLSLLFKLGLNGGSELTTLEKELEHVRHYLNLQQQCYRGLFQYEIQVEDEALLPLPVAKIILQPLAENAILHGFRELEEEGFIRITARRSGGFLLLEIEDNGSGMDVKTVTAGMLQKEPAKKSYALKNVYGRIKLLHGETAELSFTSEPEPIRSTRAVIKIPIEGEASA
ncbi:histidine kinase [Paenibacillus mesotrionivorans]|uniref:Histidine kinase n=1 Tax=Paenibacillus mesotrionivorans TaxID=3160968 RepID=A0ACC7P6G4_9BACL